MMNSLHLQIVSSVIGFVGTLIMFFNGYNLKPTEGAVWGGPEVDEHNKKIDRENKRIIIMQRLGMGLLTLSFLCQGMSFTIS